MLFALVSPVAFVALVLSFLLALAVRAVAIRATGRRLGLLNSGDPIAPRLREDIDPFGAVAAAVAGVGWGKVISVDEVPTFRGRGRAATVFIAGPVACILLAQIFFLAYALTATDNALSFLNPSMVLRGVHGPVLDQVLLSFAVGLLSFGLLAIIPIPPLDGFGILWFALRRPGAGMQWMRLWFEEKNVGVLILLILALFPLGGPFLTGIVDILGLVFVRLWG